MTIGVGDSVSQIPPIDETQVGAGDAYGLGMPIIPTITSSDYVMVALFAALGIAMAMNRR